MATRTERRWTAEEQAVHREAWKAKLRSGYVSQGQCDIRDRINGAMGWLGIGYDLSGLGEWWQDSDGEWWYGTYPDKICDNTIGHYYGYDFSILDPYYGLYWTYIDEGIVRYERGDGFKSMANWMDYIDECEFGTG